MQDRIRTISQHTDTKQGKKSKLHFFSSHIHIHWKNQDKKCKSHKYHSNHKRQPADNIHFKRRSQNRHILNSRWHRMFVCHCDHNLCSSFSLKGKYPVLNLLLVIVRIRISHLPHQFPINIQLVSRKNLCQANSILFFFFRKHQGHPIGTTSKRRFIFVAQVHSTVLANGNITAVVVLLLFLYFLRCQQYIRIIFPFPGKIM